MLTCCWFCYIANNLDSELVDNSSIVHVPFENVVPASAFTGVNTTPKTFVGLLDNGLHSNNVI